MTALVPAHPLVRAEWPHITELPPYDFRVATESVHVGVYVRRIASGQFIALAGLINHVVVAPDRRGRGLGASAVQAALAWLERGLQVPYALLHCDPALAGFYDRLGFAPAPNFPAPTHRGPRLSMVWTRDYRDWPDIPIEYVEPW